MQTTTKLPKDTIEDSTNNIDRRENGDASEAWINQGQRKAQAIQGKDQQTSENVLEIRNLSLEFKSEDRVVRVVNGVSLYIRRGETLGLVGESGCGKSVTSMSIMRLIDSPPGNYPTGEIIYRGEDLLKKTENQMAKIRGNDISMIFQEPMTSLNPVITIGAQIEESLFIHTKLTKKEVKIKAVDMLKKVRIPRPEEIYKAYPHELSGGMRQRAMIAIALACGPNILIADEPTTALDVTIQAQILELMGTLKNEIDTSILFITHDLGVVAEMCDRVAVMYSGEIVEQADVYELYKNPKHPYTRGLLKSIPKIGQTRGILPSIPGQVPLPGTFTHGCKFRDRCAEVMEICHQQDPEFLEIEKEHYCRCFLYTKIDGEEVRFHE